MKELTLRSVILGAVLSAVLSAANAYLGLFAGMTVSASIPASVVSMALLRAVRGSILENNLVQTSASAGESVAAGAIFTLPALVLLGAWKEFDYVWTVLLVGGGGVLGVLFTIPLRQALVVESSLPFPEGVATAEVLKAGHADGRSPGLFALVLGAVLGTSLKVIEGGFELIRASVGGATVWGGRVFAFGANASPALVAVGYICGLNVALLMVFGGLLNWWIVLPHVADATASSPFEAASIAWATKTRYLGVGAMTVGGLGAVIGLRRELVRAATSLVRAVIPSASSDVSTVPERERDLSGKTLFLLLIGASVALLIPFFWLVSSKVHGFLLLGLVLTTGFLFCAVAGYMAGLVGSSHNPVSGVTIATILVTAFVLLLFGMTSDASSSGFSGPAATVLVGTAVCTAAAIGGDTMQDLKAGHVLRASPWQQQLVQLIGVIAAALVLAPVLQLLLDVHGFGVATPEHPKPLRAPQATLMSAVASGVFGGSLPLGFVLGGALISLVAFATDAYSKKRGAAFRTPPLAIAVGLYLPLELSVPVAIGGACSHFAARRRARAAAHGAEPEGAGAGVLLAAGLITGEALSGLGLAALAGARGHAGPWLALEGPWSGPLAVLALLGVGYGLWRIGSSPPPGGGHPPDDAISRGESATPK